MLKVTPKATQLMADFFKDKEKSPIRLFVRMGGCGIRMFGVSLENPRKSDELFEIDGYTYIINKRVLNMVQPIRVDSDGVRFLIKGSGVNTTAGCGTCGVMCGVRKGGRCNADCVSCKNKCDYGRALLRDIRASNK